MPACTRAARSRSITSIPNRSRRRRRLPEGHGRDPGARRFRQARHRRQDCRHPLCARKQGAVSRHLPRHAARGDRVRAQRRRPDGRAISTEFDPATAASGDRADHRMAGPRRPGRDAQRTVRPGRHHAPGRPGVPSSKDGTLARECTARPASPNATAIATRSTTPCWRELRRPGLVVAGRAPGTDLCEMVELPTDPSLVRRLPVPPRIHQSTPRNGHPLFIPS